MSYLCLLSGLICSCASFGFLDAAQPRQDQGETRYWAGIITVRPVGSADSVYLVPGMVKDEAGASIQYHAQDQMPLTIRRVMEDSPASRAGLLSGDILMEYAGTPLRVHADLVAAIQTSAGGAAVLRLSRGGEVLELEFVAIPRPADYTERVLRDRAAEQAEAGLLPVDSDAGVVVLPAKLTDLLALAAKGAAVNESEADRTVDEMGEQAEGLELQNRGQGLDEVVTAEAAESVNFDRSTRLLMEKLDEFSREWVELLERQRQTLRQWSGQF